MKKNFFKLLILFGLAICFSQAQNINIEPLIHLVEANPRQAINLPLKIENLGDESYTLETSLNLPAGWRLLVPLTEVELSPLQNISVLITIFVPNNVLAGDYTVEVNLKDANQFTRQFTEKFLVRVLEKRQLELAVTKAPSFVLAEDYTANFRVYNKGNKIENLKLTAKDNLDLTLDVTPESLSLAAHSSAEVSVNVSIPKGFNKQSHQSLNFTATPLDNPDTAIFKTVEIDLIPRETSLAKTLFTFPIDIALNSRIDNSTSFDSPEAFGISLYGKGRLWDGDPGLFRMNVDATSVGKAPKFKLEYQNLAFSVSLGEQSYFLSSLIKSTSDLGISAQSGFELNDSHHLTFNTFIYPQALGLNTESTWLNSAWLNNTWFKRLNISLASFIPFEGKPTLATNFQLLSESEILQLEGGYALDLNHLAAYAWQLRAFASYAPYKASLDLDSKSIGYQGNDKNNFKVKANLSADFTNIQTELTLQYQKTQGALTIKPKLLGKLGKAHWQTAYNYKSTQTTENDSFGHEVRFQFDLPMGENFYLKQNLALQHHWQESDGVNNGVNNIVNYKVSAPFSLVEHRFLPEFELGYNFNEQNFDKLGIGLVWHGSISEAFNAKLGIDYNFFGSESFRVSFEGDYQFENGNSLVGKALFRNFYDNSSSLEISLGYNFPINVPIGKVSGLGSVKGKIYNEFGQGVADVVVQAGDLSAVTQEDGNFELANVPEGSAIFLVRSLTPNELTVPATPYPIEVIANNTTNVEVTILPAASIQGKMTVTLDGNDIINHSIDIDEVLAGIEINLITKNSEVVLQDISDKAGTFAFTGLLEGEWQLEIASESLPGDFKLEPKSQIIQLTAGENVELELKLVQRKRNFQLADGGALN